MMRFSSVALDLENDSDEDFVIPRTTDLLLKVKKSNRLMGWPSLIAWVICAAMALLSMSLSDKLGWSIYIWLGLPFLSVLGEALKRHQKEKELMIELLEALVAENNHFRRELNKLAPSKA
jgi:hypothetical protein